MINEFKLIIDDLKIPQGKLTFLLGNYGSGKTALFYALINEMK